MKRIELKYGKRKRSVKDKKCKAVSDVQEKWTRWIEYFEELLNKQTPQNLLDIEAAPTDIPMVVTRQTTEEINMAIR